MDINQQDRAVLKAKICPDCGQPIRNYFFEESRPWCKSCDVWFEFDDSGWIIRNENANQTYIQMWTRITQNEGSYGV